MNGTTQYTVQCSGDDSSPWERPEYNPCGRTEPHSDMSSRPSETSGGIYSSSKLYLVLVHHPTWWIPPLRFATVGMTKGGTCLVFIDNGSILKRSGTAHRPFPTVSLVGGTVHPHRLYLQRDQPLAVAGWRQVAAATWRGSIHPHGLYPQRPPERHIGRFLRLRRFERRKIFLKTPLTFSGNVV